MTILDMDLLFDKAIILPFNITTVIIEYLLTFMKDFKCP